MSIYNKEKELGDLENEKKLFNIQIDSYQHSIYNQIKNGGLGDEIFKTLKEPIKISRLQLLIFKIKMILKKIFDAI